MLGLKLIHVSKRGPWNFYKLISLLMPPEFCLHPLIPDWCHLSARGDSPCHCIRLCLISTALVNRQLTSSCLTVNCLWHRLIYWTVSQHKSIVEQNLCVLQLLIVWIIRTKTTRMPAFWDTPCHPMIIHTSDSHQIPSQKKTKSKLQI